MTITIDSATEARIRARAETEGISVEAYVERLLRSDQQAQDELETLALEGINSGDSIEVRTGYWEEKHRRLDELLNESNGR